MNTKSVQSPQKSKNHVNRNSPYSHMEPLVKIKLFGIGITKATEQEVLEYLVKSIQKTRKNIVVVTPNPEILVLSQHNNSLKAALNRADVALCDGMQLFRAAQLVGRPLKERIIGTNFVENLCEKVIDWPITVGFLGGRPGVAEKAAERLLKKFPKLNIVFTGSNENAFLALPKKNMPTILFVAFGAPKQELWMTEYIDKTPVRAMIGVGGAFDQIANPSLRPPRLVHQAGLGWLYRLVREPWRVKRQAKLLTFVQMVAREKLRYPKEGA